MKSVLNSFSRCFGSNHIPSPRQRDDGTSNSRSTASLPLGSSKEFMCDCDSHIKDESGEQGSSHNAGSCCQLRLDLDLQKDLEQAQFLAQARKKASAARRHRKKSPPTSAVKRKTSLEKARYKSNKKKLDIFRKEPQRASSFSKFLGPNSAIPQMLCFANPVFDSADNDLKLYRDDYTVDEETIASTAYFDAKYEHVVENRSPTPLYPEFTVPNSESHDDIIQIFNTGSHKTITNIYCSNNKPPPPPIHKADTSMMDDTSSEESSSDDQLRQQHYSSGFGEKSFQHFQEEDFRDAKRSSMMMSAACINAMPSPPVCTSRHELEVIEDLNLEVIEDTDLFEADDLPPGLKLMSKSSNSTAALTPVCSSKSNVSLSPKHGRFRSAPFFSKSVEKDSLGQEDDVHHDLFRNRVHQFRSDVDVNNFESDVPK